MNTELANRVLEMARNGLSLAWESVARSFRALVTSKAVWLASGVVFVAGFWLGHIEGAAGKRALRAEVVDLESVARQHASDAKKARAQVADLTDKTKEMEAEIARLSKGEPASEPVAAFPRARVAKAVPKKTPPAEPPKVPFWPFQN